MSEKKTLSERLENDVLTDNTKIIKFPQCRDCAFRGMEIQGEWIKDGCRSYCKIYGPKDSNGKPDEIYRGTEDCEFYEKG
jgi:hypothetical protein